MDRAKIVARIQALLSKTTTNGCTEEEALAAAEKAAELLSKYNLTMDDLNTREETVKIDSMNYSNHALWRVARAISILTGCKYWTTTNRHEYLKVSFAGLKHEVQIAHYLMDICERAVLEKERIINKNLALLTPAARRRRLIPYIDGMIDRLAERIIAMKPEDKTGTALVVVNDMIDEEMQRRGIKLFEHKSRNSRSLDDTYNLGKKAADKVGLNRGIDSECSGVRIGY